jgi:hypothetical protein
MGATLPLTNGAKELQTVEPQGSDAALMFERLARDPNASVDKIERLMALWERMEAKRAETAFNAAMAAAQKQMRPVVADATNPQTHSKYASYAALDEVLRPVYTEHGFGLSFDTGDGAPADYVRVLCYVTHVHGHSRTHHVDMPADGKGAKGGDVMTKTHASGSAYTYGQRYLLKLIFNVPVREFDDDGNAAGKRTAVPEAPAGYEDWLNDLTACADEGLEKLTAMWETKGGKSYAFKNYLTTINRKYWEDLKKRAAMARGPR